MTLEQLIQRRVPLIDVRSPGEFASGKIPGAVNIPLLDDEQRAAVGTEYKRHGSDAAVRLGHTLITAEVRDARLQAWSEYARANPDAWIYCFRGGLRSQLSCAALAEAGVSVPRLEGGYKRFRQLAIDTIERKSREENFVVLSGFTGAGKTELMRTRLADRRLCDLEKAAHHRGSAFGAFGFGSAQSSQADFENTVAAEFLRGEGVEGPIVIEDESRMIGRTVLPFSLFDRMQSAPMVVLERPLADRAHGLIRSYILENYGADDGTAIAALEQDVKSSLAAIRKTLGGEFHARLLAEVDAALAAHRSDGCAEAHQSWVEQLLERYYDPFYLHHLKKNSHRVVARGPAEEILAFLRRD